jgi:hypothetical protein
MATTDLFGQTYDPKMAFGPSPLQGSLPKDPFGTNGGMTSGSMTNMLQGGNMSFPTTQTWNSGVNPTANLGAPTSAGNVSYSPVGPQETLLDKLFGGAVTGQGGGPIAQQLFSLGQGILPQPMQDMITGTTNEQFGKLGARFGTDLATSISRGLGQAGATQSLNAINSILGLGGTTAGFQFARGESGMDRALKEYLGNLQNDPMNSLISALLGGGLG